MQKIMKEAGFRPERYNLKWASAAEAPRFVKLITDFTAEMRELGPLGKAEGMDAEELKERLKKAYELVTSQKLRIGFGNTTKAMRKDNDYSETHIAEILDKKLSKTISAGLG